MTFIRRLENGTLCLNSYPCTCMTSKVKESQISDNRGNRRA